MDTYGFVNIKPFNIVNTSPHKRKINNLLTPKPNKYNNTPESSD